MYSWRWRCFLEVLQADHLNEVNNGSRTYITRYSYGRSRLRRLLNDLSVVEKPVPGILMNCDNQTVIMKVTSSKDNMKSSRHVQGRLKSVRKMRNSGVIALDYIQTSKNLADPFTKGLSRNVIDNASREMGMRPTI